MIKPIIVHGVTPVLDSTKKSHQEFQRGTKQATKRKVSAKSADLNQRPKHKLWSGISMEI
jgi:hypothetical protein